MYNPSRPDKTNHTLHGPIKSKGSGTNMHSHKTGQQPAAAHHRRTNPAPSAAHFASYHAPSTSIRLFCVHPITFRARTPSMKCVTNKHSSRSSQPSGRRLRCRRATSAPSAAHLASASAAAPLTSPSAPASAVCRPAAALTMCAHALATYGTNTVRDVVKQAHC